ncbi:tetratricopeptide repeat protein [Luteimonas aestuarii]|uniref:Tetratricopeptide repeat protein n=1 Tax=Luteimonas aestuarii TaxID=453837 RepID=A0A4R5TY17_9GAMM|nr:tetratricopeptide repeat protein [Luteimonas aestuarii]TDK26098.1 tetratricopeptide repeat protein [Luteimonas aestuarii]
MGPILLLSILLQVGCAVHVVRTGRPMYWIFILLIGSYIAVLIYLIAEVLPELGNSRHARRAASGLRDRIDPDRGRRRAADRLEVSDTVDNRRELAEQSLRRGDPAKALELYRASLKGLYADDPHLMLGMARAQFALGMPRDARATIEALIAARPDFHSYDGHLLYARAMADGGDTTAALAEYDTLVPAYPGEEARVRHGLLLKRVGEQARAERQFRDVLRRAELSTRHYRDEQREWIAIAKAELA